MSLQSLRIYHFRNLNDSTIDLNYKNICLVGNNAQGKSNFLEAIYFSCFGSSFRSRFDRDLITYDNENLAVENTFLNANGVTEKLQIKIQNNEKKVYLNDKKINDRKDIVLLNPCVAFCHEDINFINGTPENRRWFFDHIQCFEKAEYIELMRRYKKALKIRNYLLKNQNTELLPIYTEELIRSGLALQKRRFTAIEYLNTIFEPLFKAIAGLDTKISISYRPSWKSFDYDHIFKTIRNKEFIDLQQGFTSFGPHRDQYFFLEGQKDFSYNASTGQKRLLALVLRIAQVQYIKSRLNKDAILLLDDVLLELDKTKRNSLLEVLPSFEQIFFTFLPEDSILNKMKKDTCFYNVDKGRIWKK